MSRRTRQLTLLFAVLLAIWAAPIAVSAQSGGNYDLSWSTVDGGGVTVAEGDTWKLAGTTGQPDSGGLSGGDYVLHGGFWPGGGALQVMHEVYLPLVIKG